MDAFGELMELAWKFIKIIFVVMAIAIIGLSIALTRSCNTRSSSENQQIQQLRAENEALRQAR